MDASWLLMFWGFEALFGAFQCFLGGILGLLIVWVFSFFWGFQVLFWFVFPLPTRLRAFAPVGCGPAGEGGSPGAYGV